MKIQIIFTKVVFLLLAITINTFAQETALQFNSDNKNTKNEYATSQTGNYSPIFTIEAWVKLDSAIDGEQTFLISNHIQMMRATNGRIKIYDAGNGVTLTSSSTLDLKTWMHVAYSQVEYDGAYIGKLYLNGTEEAKSYAVGGYTYTIILGNNTNSDGMIDTTDDNRWIGAIDEVRFWTTGRDSAQINNFRGKELNSNNEDDLFSYYSFNEGTGKIARDLKGSSDLSLFQMENSNWIDGVFYDGGRPVANAGDDQVIAESNANNIMLDGSASKDKNGTIVNYSWTENLTEIATGKNPVVSLTKGQHKIILTVTDNDEVIIFISSEASNKSIELNNGTLDELLVADGFDVSQKSWTVECWVKFRTLNESGVDEMHLIETAEDGLNDSTQWYVQTIDPVTNKAKHVLSSNGSGYAFGGTREKEFEINKWYHIALSVDREHYKYTWYINGEPDRDSSSITASGHPHIMQYVIIGHFRQFDYDANWSATSAKFDEIRVWYKALSQTEIKANMNKSLNNADDLEACWNFDKANFNEDVTGHGHTLNSNGRVDITNLSDDVPDFNVEVKEKQTNVPNKFSITQNYPNPFNPSTIIDFALPTSQNVKLSVFNMLGQKVAQLVNGKLSAGYHSVMFEASNLPSGIYFYKIETNSFIQTRKMILLR